MYMYSEGRQNNVSTKEETEKSFKIELLNSQWRTSVFMNLYNFHSGPKMGSFSKFFYQNMSDRLL